MAHKWKTRVLAKQNGTKMGNESTGQEGANEMIFVFRLGDHGDAREPVLDDEARSSMGRG